MFIWILLEVIFQDLTKNNLIIAINVNLYINKHKSHEKQINKDRYRGLQQIIVNQDKVRRRYLNKKIFFYHHCLVVVFLPIR